MKKESIIVKNRINIETMKTALASLFLFSATALSASNPIIALKQSVNPACYGGKTGSITVTATSGKSPYQYSINGGVFDKDSVFTGLELVAIL